jgi:hypothetical protein
VLAAAAVVPLKVAVYLWGPGAGKNASVAVGGVPFNCALPKTAASSQRVPGRDTSQKVIEPVVTGAPPAVTAAVRVTFVSDATNDEESVSVVVVGSGAACIAVAQAQAAASNSLGPRRRGEATRLQAEENAFHIETVLGSHLTELANTHRAKAAGGLGASPDLRSYNTRVRQREKSLNLGSNEGYNDGLGSSPSLVDLRRTSIIFAVASSLNSECCKFSPIGLTNAFTQSSVIPGSCGKNSGFVSGTTLVGP